MTIQIFTWCATAICLAGTVLNVRKNVLCFWLWCVGNIAWMTFDLWSHLYGRAVLDAVQLALAVWGIFAWSKKGQNDGNH